MQQLACSNYVYPKVRKGIKHRTGDYISQNTLHMMVKRQRPPRLLLEAVVIIESGAVLSCQELVVRDVLAMSLEYPCSEKGKRWITDASRALDNHLL
jgi:hypothetical protein